MDATIIHEYGSPRVAGTCITVYDIVHYLEDGDWHYTGIAEALRLTPEQVLAAMQYIEEHKDEVMAVHRQIEERIARGNPPEVEEKLKVTRARMQAWLDERRQQRNQEQNGARDPGGH